MNEKDFQNIICTCGHPDNPYLEADHHYLNCPVRRYCELKKQILTPQGKS